MMPWNRSNRRWQYSLGALFGVLTVSAFVSAAFAGSLGVPVQESIMNLATILLVVVAGIIYYVLFILVLASPIIFAVGCLKFAARIIARRPETTRDDPPPSGQMPTDSHQQ
jgi:hypothetical protein